MRDLKYSRKYYRIFKINFMLKHILFKYNEITKKLSQKYF